MHIFADLEPNPKSGTPVFAPTAQFIDMNNLAFLHVPVIGKLFAHIM